MEKMGNVENVRHNYILGQRELAIKVPEYEMIKNYAIWNYMNPFYKKELQYHYTDINGFMGIINNQELWASNTKFLNDKAEGKEGLMLTKEIITEHLKKDGLNVYFECLNMDLQKLLILEVRKISILLVFAEMQIYLVNGEDMAKTGE